jgi:hypothetical protein
MAIERADVGEKCWRAQFVRVAFPHSVAGTQLHFMNLATRTLLSKDKE